MQRRDFLRSLLAIPFAPKTILGLGCLTKKIRVPVDMDFSRCALDEAFSMFAKELYGYDIKINGDNFQRDYFVVKALVGRYDIEAAIEIEESTGIKWEVCDFKDTDEWHLVFSHPKYYGLYEVWSAGT